MKNIKESIIKIATTNLWFQCAVICLIETIFFALLAFNARKAKLDWFLGFWIITFIVFIILTIKQIYNEQRKKNI